MYVGLCYTLVAARATMVIGPFMIPEPKDRDIFAEDMARPGKLAAGPR